MRVEKHECMERASIHQQIGRVSSLPSLVSRREMRGTVVQGTCHQMNATDAIELAHRR